MPVSQHDIDELNRAIRQGESQVRFADGRTVTYRSVAELIRVRDDALAELEQINGGRRKQTRLYHAGRGFR